MAIDEKNIRFIDARSVSEWFNQWGSVHKFDPPPICMYHDAAWRRVYGIRMIGEQNCSVVLAGMDQSVVVRGDDAAYPFRHIERGPTNWNFLL